MGWIAGRFGGHANDAFTRILAAMEAAMEQINGSPYATHDDTRICVAISRESLHVLRRAKKNGLWCATEMDRQQRTKEVPMTKRGAAYNVDYGVHNLIAKGVDIDREMRLEMVALRFMDHCLPLPDTPHQADVQLFPDANAGCVALDRLASALAVAASDVRVHYVLEAAEKAPNRIRFFRELVARPSAEGRIICAIHHQGRAAIGTIPTIVRYALGFLDRQGSEEVLRRLSAILARILAHGDIPLWHDAGRTIADVIGPIAQAVSIKESKP